MEPYELEALPTDARNPLRLAFNVPGVSQSTGFFGDAPPLTIHGDNALYTQYTVDGLDNNEGFLGGPRVALPLSALERLSVHTAAYRPAMGRSTNGVVDMETRAGTEAWSGEVLVVNRPGLPLDAEAKFAPAGMDPEGFQRTQVGGAMGGPLARGRTFLFSAVEYTREQEDRIGSTARTAFLGTEERETWKGFLRLDHGWSPTQSTTLRSALSDVRRRGQGGGVIVPEADITTRRIGSLTNLTHRTAFREGRGSHVLSAQVGTFTWDFPPSASDLETPQVTIVSPDLTTVEAVVGSSNFIFDEAELQLQLKDEVEIRAILDVQAEYGPAMMWVTHDLEEAGRLADRVAVLLDGTIVQVGTPEDIFRRPASAAVARFLGLPNELPGMLDEAGRLTLLEWPLRGGRPFRAVRGFGAPSPGRHGDLRSRRGAAGPAGRRRRAHAGRRRPPPSPGSHGAGPRPGHPGGRTPRCSRRVHVRDRGGP